MSQRLSWPYCIGFWSTNRVALRTVIRVIRDIERKVCPLQLTGVLMIYDINIYNDKDNDNDIDNPVRPGQLFKLLATS